MCWWFGAGQTAFRMTVVENELWGYCVCGRAYRATERFVLTDVLSDVLINSCLDFEPSVAPAADVLQTRVYD